MSNERIPVTYAQFYIWWHSQHPPVHINPMQLFGFNPIVHDMTSAKRAATLLALIRPELFKQLHAARMSPTMDSDVINEDWCAHVRAHWDAYDGQPNRFDPEVDIDKPILVTFNVKVVIPLAEIDMFSMKMERAIREKLNENCAVKTIDAHLPAVLQKSAPSWTDPATAELFILNWVLTTHSTNRPHSKITFLRDFRAHFTCGLRDAFNAYNTNMTMFTILGRSID